MGGWVWLAILFILSCLSSPSSGELLWTPGIQHSYANCIGKPRRGMRRRMRPGAEGKDNPGRGQDQ